ncbi:phospholipase A1 VesT1.02-like [Drosophila novamexicana]|uniref:phospholipase A1 VesT1.02-like n=1 Tax=Drosophila novamexicana TaxID=47314 RepID=UPI0011E58E28|nr:phospholipase A1 VesT1.02-like [Drosophila novamexicana]
MKVILVLTALLAAGTSLSTKERIHGENGWYVPKIDGTRKWMDLHKAKKLLVNVKRFVFEADVSFYLYTSSNPTNGEEISSSEESIYDSHFNKKHPTRFVIHGWTKSYLDSLSRIITKAWLSSGEYNIIVVDWAGARTNYLAAVLAVPGVGARVGDMIEYLHDSHGMSLKSLIVIGHSLGAHVAGYAGKTVGSGRIHTIIGLDPALPLFSYYEPNRRLSSNDAFYVETIHTNGGIFGFLKPIGKGAFYPNGGIRQPNCSLVGFCSHVRAVIYYAEAVTRNNFAAIKCRNFIAAIGKDCGRTYTHVRMGAVTNANRAEGTYYVPVKQRAPFGYNNLPTDL